MQSRFSPFLPKRRENFSPKESGNLEKARDYWCGWLESNQRPLASEANTLSTELQPRRGNV